MNILALAATTSRQSINARLLSHAADVLAADILPGAKISFLDLNDFEMPIYSVDREAASGIPEAAKRFHAAIGAADALLFAFAEHNGHFTAAYKNLFDWTSRVEKVGAMSNLYQGKPMVALGTSPGPGGAQHVLNFVKTTAPYFAADVRASFSLPGFGDNFDVDTGQIRAESLVDELRIALATLGAPSA